MQNDIETEVLPGYLSRVMEEKGIDATGIARLAGLAASTVTRVMNGGQKSMRSTSLEAIERGSGIPLPPELAAKVRRTAPVPLEVRADTIRLFPLIGSPEPGCFFRNDMAAEAVARPAGLVHAQAAYAVRMPDESMVPWRRANELVFLNPHWACGVGDHVLVELSKSNEPNQHLYMIRIYGGRTRDGGWQFRAYNPDSIESLPKNEVTQVIRALEWSEATALR